MVCDTKESYKEELELCHCKLATLPFNPQCFPFDQAYPHVLCYY